MTKIRVTIIDDHQGILDGCLYRLEKQPDIEIVATLRYGQDLNPSLAANPVDVLVIDAGVPMSKADDAVYYPLLYWIPELHKLYPEMNFLVISVHDTSSLINAVMKAGASGYIIKDDGESIANLADIVRKIASNGVYLSPRAEKILTDKGIQSPLRLSRRQAQTLSYCAAYPEKTTEEIAHDLQTAHSTVRNLLSNVYDRLDVPNRGAATERLRQLGLLPDLLDKPDMLSLLHPDNEPPQDAEPPEDDAPPQLDASSQDDEPPYDYQL